MDVDDDYGTNSNKPERYKFITVQIGSFYL